MNATAWTPSSSLPDCRGAFHPLEFTGHPLRAKPWARCLSILGVLWSPPPEPRELVETWRRAESHVSCQGGSELRLRGWAVERTLRFWGGSPSGLTSVLVGNWDQDDNDVLLLPSPCSSSLLRCHTGTWPPSGLLTRLLPRGSPASVGCLLRFRVSRLLSLSGFPPASPHYGLPEGLPCPGCRRRWVLTSPTFCLSLQPLSAAGILSSSSTTSNRSRNKTRYRTKAVSSEVDESLFGGVKVTLAQPLPGGPPEEDPSSPWEQRHVASPTPASLTSARRVKSGVTSRGFCCREQMAAQSVPQDGDV